MPALNSDRHSRAPHGHARRSPERIPLVQDGRRSLRRTRSEAPSVHSLYWPFYIGVGLPLIGIWSVLTVMIAGSSDNIMAGLMFAWVIPFFMIFPLLSLSIPLTYLLSSFNTAARTTNKLFSWSERPAGYRLGAGVGAGLALYYNPDFELRNLFTDTEINTSQLAWDILNMLAFIGIGGVIGQKAEGYLVTRETAGTKPSHAEADKANIKSPLPPPLEISMTRRSRATIAAVLTVLAFALSLISMLGPEPDIPLSQRFIVALGFGFGVYFYTGVYAALLRRLQSVFGVTLKFTN